MHETAMRWRYLIFAQSEKLNKIRAALRHHNFEICDFIMPDESGPVFGLQIRIMDARAKEVLEQFPDITLEGIEVEYGLPKDRAYYILDLARVNAALWSCQIEPAESVPQVRDQSPEGKVLELRSEHQKGALNLKLILRAGYIVRGPIVPSSNSALHRCVASGQLVQPRLSLFIGPRRLAAPELWLDEATALGECFLSALSA